MNTSKNITKAQALEQIKAMKFPLSQEDFETVISFQRDNLIEYKELSKDFREEYQKANDRNWKAMGYSDWD